MKKVRKKKNSMVIRGLAVSILLLVTVESICAIYSGDMQRYIQSENKKQMEETAKAAANGFEQQLNEYMSVTEAMCYCIPDYKRVLDIENIKTINMMSCIKYVHSSYLVDTSGMAISNKGITVDMRENTLAKSVLKSGRKNCSEAVYDVDGENAVFYVGNPIYDQNNMLTGAGIVAVKSSVFSDYIAEFTAIGRSVCMLIDEKGRVIDSYNGKNSSLKKVDNLFDCLQKAEYEGKEGYTRLINDITTKRTNQGEFRKDGVDYYISYTPVRKVNGYLAVIYEASKVYEAANGIKQYMHYVEISILCCFVLFSIVMIVMNNLSAKGAWHRHKELEEKAEIDGLAAVYNKLATEKHIQDYLKNEGKNGRCILFIIDIDDFKVINDTKGHAFGDIVISSIGRGLGTEFRATDIVGRIGGDEFLVFLKDIPNYQVQVREAERLVRFFHTLHPGEYVKTKITASIGGSVYPDDGKDFETLYKAADEAAYRTKKSGKDGYSFYSEKYENQI